jgi:peptidoglycan hydrolase CwlO-like protein
MTSVLEQLEKLYTYYKNQLANDETDPGAKKYYEIKLNTLDVAVQKLLENSTPNQTEIELYVSYHKLEQLQKKIDDLSDDISKTSDKRLEEIGQLEKKIQSLRGELNIPPQYKKRLFS